MILPLILVLFLQSPADAILGRWEGSSTCVKAGWNTSCHDEVTRYDFVRDSTRPGVIVTHAYKQVGSDWDWMGDVDVRWDSAGHRWAGEWGNSRVHIEWSFWLQGEKLAGQLVSLPDRRKSRDVLAHR
jgi:hypothetical protein